MRLLPAPIRAVTGILDVTTDGAPPDTLHAWRYWRRQTTQLTFCAGGWDVRAGQAPQRHGGRRRAGLFSRRAADIAAFQA